MVFGGKVRLAIMSLDKHRLEFFLSWLGVRLLQDAFTLKNFNFKKKCSIIHVLEPIYILRAFNTVTCISCLWRWAGWSSLFCGSTQKPASATANSGKTRERFRQKNVGEWTGKIEISKEPKEIPDSWRSANAGHAPFDAMQGRSVMHPEAIRHSDWTVATAVVLLDGGIMEALSRTSPNSNSSAKDRVQREGQGQPWLICKEHSEPLLPCSCQTTQNPIS